MYTGLGVGVRVDHPGQDMNCVTLSDLLQMRTVLVLFEGHLMMNQHECAAQAPQCAKRVINNAAVCGPSKFEIYVLVCC